MQSSCLVYLADCFVNQSYEISRLLYDPLYRSTRPGGAACSVLKHAQAVGPIESRIFAVALTGVSNITCAHFRVYLWRHINPRQCPRLFEGFSSVTDRISTSLPKVKILSDKTIVFHSGLETKERAVSIDSASVNELRRERLIARSQISSEESDCSSVRSARCRGASLDKIDLARKLGLKTGDLAKPAPHRSRSVGSSTSSEVYTRRRILNKNQLASPTGESSTVISADSLKNSRASIDYGLQTSARDAFGYVALSNLRRQRSFNRDLEAKTNAYKPGG